MTLTMRFSAALILVASVPSAAVADNDNRYHPHRFTYEVTITNITKGQVFSPPVLVTHTPDIALFALGAPVSKELALVAEAGDGGPLVHELSSLRAIAEAKATLAPIMPGESAVYEISSNRSARKLSVVAMLVNTNDAFFALDSETLPWGRHASRSYYALGYDAGSEGNNEGCAFIPGPACPAGSGNDRSTEDAEEYAHIHNGVHGIADLQPNAYDWRNPVAKVEITRTR